VIVARTPAEVRAAVCMLSRPLGLVPTMGALHAGHLALVARARAENAAVAASLFVNPLQFGPGEDFERYPRAFAGDCAALEAAGVAVVYAPRVETVYPAGFVTSIELGGIATRYEGALRPGHFSGVATVVAKLFSVVQPDRAYFGAKDAQQCVVIQQLVRDLDLPVEIVISPTIREHDGLALSSRNVYLNAAERAAAPGLHLALEELAAAISRGEDDRDAALARARALLASPLREAYLDAVDPRTFEAAPLRAPAIAIGSAWLGTTRLLDNIGVAGADGRDPLVTPALVMQR